VVGLLQMSAKAKIHRKKTGDGKICESIHAFLWFLYETARADGEKFMKSCVF